MAHAISAYNNCMPTVLLCIKVCTRDRTRTYCVLLESLCKLVAKVNYNMFQFNPNLLECGGAMRPQRKIMMVETTRAFVKLKQIKVAEEKI